MCSSNYFLLNVDLNRKIKWVYTNHQSKNQSFWVPYICKNICFWRSDQFLLRLSCRDHGSRARLQQEAGGSVVCSVSGPTALPPGSHRGVLRSHQEEGGRNCMSRTSSALFQTFNWEICCIVCVSFCLFVSSWRCSRSAWLQTCSSSWPVSSRSLESTSPHLWVTWTTKTDHWSVCDPSNG